jgi:hypothetical protein
MKAIYNALKNPDLLRYGGNTAWLLAERITQMGLAFIVGIFIARSLGPAAFGLLNFAISFGLLFAPLVLMGMDQILVKELVTRPNEERVILGSGIALRFIGFGVMAAVAAGSSFLLTSDERTRIMILLVLMGYAGVAMNGIDAFFQARICVRYTAMATISGSIIFAALNLLGCFYRFDLYFFALTNGMIVLFSASVKWWIYNHSFSGIRQWRCSGREMKNILMQSHWLFWQLAMNAVAANIGYLILKLVCDDQVIGFYSVVIKVTACFVVIPEVICLSLFPLVIHAAGNPALYRRRLSSLYFGNFWGGMAMVGAAFLAGKFLVVLLYGGSYVQQGPSLTDIAKELAAPVAQFREYAGLRRRNRPQRISSVLAIEDCRAGAVDDRTEGRRAERYPAIMHQRFGGDRKRGLPQCPVEKHGVPRNDVLGQQLMQRNPGRIEMLEFLRRFADDIQIPVGDFRVGENQPRNMRRIREIPPETLQRNGNLIGFPDIVVIGKHNKISIGSVQQPGKIVGRRITPAGQ